mgnify:CR=1 FL=1
MSPTMIWRLTDSWPASVEALTELAGRFAHHLKAVTGVSAAVTILPPDTLPRATHKAKRVEDRRTGVWA